MNAVKKIINGISSAVTYLILAVIVAMVVLLACGVRPYITMSGSMEPAIKTGSLCFVNTKADFYDVEEGDVIAYESASGGMVTHRVIDKEDGLLETMGDANDVSDGFTTSYSNFRGKTIFSIPYAGYGVVYLQKPQNIAIVGVIIAAIVLVNIVDSLPEKNKKDEEQ